jgi:hypothetical protein
MPGSTLDEVKIRSEQVNSGKVLNQDRLSSVSGSDQVRIRSEGLNHVQIKFDPRFNQSQL